MCSLADSQSSSQKYLPWPYTEAVAANCFSNFCHISRARPKLFLVRTRMFHLQRSYRPEQWHIISCRNGSRATVNGRTRREIVWRGIVWERFYCSDLKNMAQHIVSQNTMNTRGECECGEWECCPLCVPLPFLLTVSFCAAVRCIPLQRKISSMLSRHELQKLLMHCSCLIM